MVVEILPCLKKSFKKIFLLFIYLPTSTLITKVWKMSQVTSFLHLCHAVTVSISNLLNVYSLNSKPTNPPSFFKYCHNMSNAIYEVCVCTYCAAAYITDAIFPLFSFGCQFSHFWHWAKWCFVTLKRVFYTYTCAVLWLDSSFFIPLDSRKDLFRSRICMYITYFWDFLHFFITSSSLLAIANTNIMDNDAWLANVRSESQTLFRSGSVIRFLVFRIRELFFWLWSMNLVNQIFSFFTFRE